MSTVIQASLYSSVNSNMPFLSANKYLTCLMNNWTFSSDSSENCSILSAVMLSLWMIFEWYFTETSAMVDDVEVRFDEAVKEVLLFWNVFNVFKAILNCHISCVYSLAMILLRSSEEIDLLNASSLNTNDTAQLQTLNKFLLKSMTTERDVLILNDSIEV